ncbi:MAG: protein-glutamate O-methyltransferase family protein [Candidatus Omnitrophica bacterium]|nr:protein-glutamate O-methyltransferase family protein [Candidatus Omnitrophota bacterium]
MNKSILKTILIAALLLKSAGPYPAASLQSSTLRPLATRKSIEAVSAFLDITARLVVESANPITHSYADEQDLKIIALPDGSRVISHFRLVSESTMDPWVIRIIKTPTRIHPSIQLIELGQSNAVVTDSGYALSSGKDVLAGCVFVIIEALVDDRPLPYAVAHISRKDHIREIINRDIAPEHPIQQCIDSLNQITGQGESVRFQAMVIGTEVYHFSDDEPNAAFVRRGLKEIWGIEVPDGCYYVAGKNGAFLSVVYYGRNEATIEVFKEVPLAQPEGASQNSGQPTDRRFRLIAREALRWPSEAAFQTDAWSAFDHEGYAHAELGAKTASTGAPQPAPVMTDKGFAHDSMEWRLPDEVIPMLLGCNEYPPENVAAYELLQREMRSNGFIQPVSPMIPNSTFLNNRLERMGMPRWWNAEYLGSENHFEWRKLESAGYFSNGPLRGKDPAEKKKLESVIGNGKAIDQFIAEYRRLEESGQFTDKEILHELLLDSMWGNREDISHDASGKAREASAKVGRGDDLIIANDLRQAVDLLSPRLNGQDPFERFDVIADNSGPEITFDFYLADFLLRKEVVKTIYFHLKDVPYYISDTMRKDVDILIERLLQVQGSSAEAFAQRLNQYIKEGAIIFTDDTEFKDPEMGYESSFWTSGLPFIQMPPGLIEELAKSDFVIIKGDLNYRRLFGDLQWDPDTPLSIAAGYFPAPFLVLRTLKSDIAVNLRTGQAEVLEKEDPLWLSNGKRAVAQLYLKPGSRLEVGLKTGSTGTLQRDRVTPLRPLVPQRVITVAIQTAA